jgi:osmoprotectant transport system permease protein
MGYRPARRFLDIELPLAIPVLIAGLRVATVSSISLVSVGALIGVGGLGEFFTEGFQLQFPTEVIVGVALIVLLALAGDAVLLVIGRTLTPWNRQASGSKA